MTQDQAGEAAIVIAAYNSETTIARAVRSALDQACVREVIVIDDASRDGTVAAARACEDGSGRLRVLRQDANAGPAAARNRGFAAAQAPWIGVLDADDYMLAGRVARLIAHAGDADFIADALMRVEDGAATPPAPAAWSANGPSLRRIGFADFVAGNLARKSALDLGFIKPLARRAFLEQHALRYRADMRLGEDYELYARALALGARLAIAPPAGYISVVRDGSLSRRHNAADLELLRDCDDSLARIRPFDAAELRALRRHRTSVDCRYQWRQLIIAVKTRSAHGALATFTSPQVSLYLAARLAEQAWLRGGAWLTGARRVRA